MKVAKHGNDLCRDAWKHVCTVRNGNDTVLSAQDIIRLSGVSSMARAGTLAADLPEVQIRVTETNVRDVLAWFEARPQRCQKLHLVLPMSMARGWSIDSLRIRKKKLLFPRKRSLRSDIVIDPKNRCVLWRIMATLRFITHLDVTIVDSPCMNASDYIDFCTDVFDTVQELKICVRTSTDPAVTNQTLSEWTGCDPFISGSRSTRGHARDVDLDHEGQVLSWGDSSLFSTDGKPKTLARCTSLYLENLTIIWRGPDPMFGAPLHRLHVSEVCWLCERDMIMTSVGMLTITDTFTSQCLTCSNVEYLDVSDNLDGMVDEWHDNKERGTLHFLHGSRVKVLEFRLDPEPESLDHSEFKEVQHVIKTFHDPDYDSELDILKLFPRIVTYTLPGHHMHLDVGALAFAHSRVRMTTTFFFGADQSPCPGIDCLHILTPDIYKITDVLRCNAIQTNKLNMRGITFCEMHGAHEDLIFRLGLHLRSFRNVYTLQFADLSQEIFDIFMHALDPYTRKYEHYGYTVLEWKRRDVDM